ncbi:unnamed protein product, partial [Schistosoma curassoni]|uniref:Reverse transcriptase domain-containing protein n=1 Tax=Schistosoma curassoni TaxID=6186 RepID=A0A183KZW7_9TREM
MTAEKAARGRNMKQLYDTTKKLSGNRGKAERPVKSKEGEAITNMEEQQNRWVEHFKELLNRLAPLNPPNIEAAPTDLPINVGPPTIEEISMAIRQMKRQLTKSFKVKTGVRQDCLLSPVLFLLMIDWIMKTSTSEGKRGMQLTSKMQLHDLDFADDLALLSQTRQQMQEKTNSVAAASAAVGLIIHKGKGKILRNNTACTSSITIDGEDLEDVKTFTYLGSIIDEQGASDAD